MINTRKQLVVFFFDILIIITAYCGAFLLDVDFSIPVSNRGPFLYGLLASVAIKPLAFLFSGMYRSIWRNASLQDAVDIFKSVALASLISFFTLMILNLDAGFSSSFFILDWMMLLFMISGSRFLLRLYRERVLLPRRGTGRRTLIIGAGDAGSLLLKEIRRQAKPSYAVIGFVDDDLDKQGLTLHGLPVLGTTAQLKGVLRKYRIEKVIIAIPSATGKTTGELVRKCEQAKVSVKTLPKIVDLIGGKITISQVKDVEIDDLLGRNPVTLNEEAISDYLAGKRILVTGAAGSIGSEICRQVAKFGPTKILALDCAETPLFFLEKELAERWPKLQVVPLIADIRDPGRLQSIFEEFLPQAVFHAAAYKHVPMMEYNPGEAVLNNIGGTRNLADVSVEYGVANFVMISTDKAVNPTNVMGATKRAAERYIQALARNCPSTNFTTVRFGNVLGSNGSVIPLFKEQIRRGGPVRVTDPKMTRYFMTIPEASQLVLQAGCIGKGGEIFLLDMGQPVRILDLAEEMIRLSGLEPYDDIDIVFTGLRPGEKMYEELLIKGEGVKPTAHQKIKVLEGTETDPEEITVALEELFDAARNSDIPRVMRLLRRIVPEFSPAYSFTGKVPTVFQRLRPDLFPKREFKLVSGN